MVAKTVARLGINALTGGTSAPVFKAADHLLPGNSQPKVRRRVNLPAWVTVAILVFAVIGTNSLFHFFTWPSLPSIFGSAQAAPPELSPVLVKPIVPVKLEQIQDNYYAIDYTSPLMCRTLFGGCIPDSYAKKEIREIGKVSVYAKDVILPENVGIAIVQASATKPGTITYTLHVATPVLGKPTADENTIHVEEFVDFNGHTTAIPTDQEIRVTALVEVARVAAADTNAISAAKTTAEKTLTDQVTGIAQPLLDALSKKGLLNGKYTILVNVLWDGTDLPIAP